MALTHLQIRNAKPAGRAYKMADTDCLYLLVETAGTKLWRMNYRHLGRQRTLYFGAWPGVGLAAARERRDRAREQLAAGQDPVAESHLAKQIAANKSFKTVAKEWMVKCEREGRARVTLEKIRWLLGMAIPIVA